MTTGKPAGKGQNILGALMDLLILVLLVGGAGFGGYYWGTIQKMAPVQGVAAGTPGALPAQAPTPTVTSSTASKVAPAAVPVNTHENPEPTTAKTTTEPATETPAPVSGKKGAKKYWISSFGSDYIGYSITVTVNGTPVDSFFGPGKTVDVTRLIKTGENTIDFEAKELGKGYNKHKGDENFALVLKLVSGPYVQENFKETDVIKTYKRNAAETEDFKSSEEFVKD